EKTGKTTPVSLLLHRRREGGQLLGRMVQPGRTILCSEENDRLWALRQPPLNFGSQLEYHRPMGLNPSPGRWRRYIDHLLDLPQDSFDLLVIDTVMSFLPAAQNNPGGLRKALNELRVIAGLPAGVPLLHQTSAAHPFALAAPDRLRRYTHRPASSRRRPAPATAGCARRRPLSRHA